MDLNSWFHRVYVFVSIVYTLASLPITTKTSNDYNIVTPVTVVISAFEVSEIFSGISKLFVTLIHMKSGVPKIGR